MYTSLSEITIHIRLQPHNASIYRETGCLHTLAQLATCELHWEVIIVYWPDYPKTEHRPLLPPHLWTMRDLVSIQVFLLRTTVC